MKTKTLEKKLVFNKKTITQLSDDRLDEVKGGITNTCISVWPVQCTQGCPPSRVAYTECSDMCVP